MGQFRLGRAKRPRDTFEPRTFGFHSQATRETAVWVQTLTWTLERSTALPKTSEDERTSATALRRFLRDYYQNPGSIILFTSKPLQLVLVGSTWKPGQSPRLKLPTSLGAVSRTLASLCEKALEGQKPSPDEPTSTRVNLGDHKNNHDSIIYTSGTRIKR